MKKAITPKDTLDEINLVLPRLENLVNSYESETKFIWTMFIGLMFGLLSSLVISLFNDLYISTFSEGTKALLLILILGIMAIISFLIHMRLNTLNDRKKEGLISIKRLEKGREMTKHFLGINA